MVSDAMCELLNEATYKYDVFYRIDGRIYVDNILIESVLLKNSGKTLFLSKEEEFKESNISKKLNIIYGNTRKFEEINIDVLAEGVDELEEYTPGHSVDNVTKKVCDTGNYMVNQQNLPICWAACVASTYNYFYGKHISAKTVSKKVIGEYAGANSICSGRNDF